MKTVITGATGKLGSLVIRNLLKSYPANELGISVRNPEKVDELKQMGIRVRRGDFEDIESLNKSFEGASQVLIISPNVTGETAVTQHRNAIDAAKKAGVNRILYTSHIGSSLNSFFPPMLSHAKAEAYLTQAEIPFTSFRNGFYAESATQMLEQAIKTGELRLPEDGKVAWTSHEDLAHVVALTLKSHDIEGITPNLTASEILDFSDIASILSEIIGKDIKRIIITDESYADEMKNKGFPPEIVQLMVGLFKASRKDEFSQTGPLLKKIIEREPISMKQILEKKFGKTN